MLANQFVLGSRGDPQSSRITNPHPTTMTVTAAADDAVASPLPSDGDRDGPSLKRHRREEPTEKNQVALYAPPLEDDVDQDSENNIRTSSLAEPTMKLSGHKGSVYCLAYDPQGEVLCSGSFDSTCLLWKGELCGLQRPYDFLIVYILKPICAT